MSTSNHCSMFACSAVRIVRIPGMAIRLAVIMPRRGTDDMAIGRARRARVTRSGVPARAASCARACRASTAAPCRHSSVQCQHGQGERTDSGRQRHRIGGDSGQQTDRPVRAQFLGSSWRAKGW